MYFLGLKQLLLKKTLSHACFVVTDVTGGGASCFDAHATPISERERASSSSNSLRPQLLHRRGEGVTVEGNNVLP